MFTFDSDGYPQKRQFCDIFVTLICDCSKILLYLCGVNDNLRTMDKTKKTYKKENVKVQFVDKADGRKSIRFEIYLSGKRTYERIPDLYIIPEVDEASVKKNRATLNKVEVMRRHRQAEINKALAEAKAEADKEAQSKFVDYNKMTISEWLVRYKDIQKARGMRSIEVLDGITRLISLYNGDVLLKKVDKDYCLGFIDFLRNKYTTRAGERLSQISCFNFLGDFRTALNVAVQEGIIDVNPITLIPSSEKFKPIEHVREYLTIDELKRLIATPCKSEVVKQAFLFACYCGLRYGDIKSLTWADIRQDGERWTVATRIAKTQRFIQNPLPTKALKWLPKRSNDSDKVFPGLSKEMTRRYVHAWAKDAGIANKNVTFHVSRHTYATMLLTFGADLYTVSKLLGHTSIRHTQRYAKIVNSLKDDH
jgi:integrase